MKMPTQLGSPNVDAKLNATLVAPIPTSEKAVTLYCLGGQWRQQNGQPMPSCVNPKTTGKWQSLSACLQQQKGNVNDGYFFACLKHHKFNVNGSHCFAYLHFLKGSESDSHFVHDKSIKGKENNRHFLHFYSAKKHINEAIIVPT